jgi:phage baseplate assembly protein gpV
MSSALYDSITRIARHETAARSIAAVGRVVDVFPNQGLPDHAVSVELRDTGLVLPQVPVAVGVMGFAAIPAVDELVVVVFAGGDLNAPLVVGRLYNSEQDPPEHAEGEIVLALPSGVAQPKLSLKVTGDAPHAEIKLPGDVLVDLAEDVIQLKAGSTQVTVEGSGGGRVEVKAGSSTITVKADGDISLSTSTKLKLEASEIEIKGSAKVKISGGLVEIN